MVFEDVGCRKLYCTLEKVGLELGRGISCLPRQEFDGESGGGSKVVNFRKALNERPVCRKFCCFSKNSVHSRLSVPKREMSHPVKSYSIAVGSGGGSGCLNGAKRAVQKRTLSLLLKIS